MIRRIKIEYQLMTALAAHLNRRTLGGPRITDSEDGFSFFLRNRTDSATEDNGILGKFFVRGNFS